MTLTALEFLRRLSHHILPRGFVRIRHFGFLTNTRRSALLTVARQLIATVLPPIEFCSAQLSIRRPPGTVLTATRLCASVRICRLYTCGPDAAPSTAHKILQSRHPNACLCHMAPRRSVSERGAICAQTFLPLPSAHQRHRLTRSAPSFGPIRRTQSLVKTTSALSKHACSSIARSTPSAASSKSFLSKLSRIQRPPSETLPDRTLTTCEE